MEIQPPAPRDSNTAPAGSGSHPLGYFDPRGEKPPTSVTALSVIAATVGFFGIIGGLIAMTDWGMIGPPAPHARWVQLFIAFNHLAMLTLFVTLLVGGVAGLALRRWARRWLVIWSLVDLGWIGVKCIIRPVIAVVDHPQTRDLRNLLEQSGVNTKAMTTRTLVWTDIALIVAASVMLSILPICILIYWRRQAVIDAFERRDPSV